jgi:hypothetical protein
MKKLAIFGVTLAAFLVLTVGAFGQAKARVRFPAGTHGTSVSGTVRGYAYRDYVVGASAGQTMNLHLTASEPATVLTVFLPNGDNLDGATEADQFSGELPTRGDYIIRVLMMRSAARRKGSVSNFTLKISIR